ncbi:hypothetical protein ACQP2P_11625 [Dactylosporangium sp. CA-139114]
MKHTAAQAGAAIRLGWRIALAAVLLTALAAGLILTVISAAT